MPTSINNDIRIQCLTDSRDVAIIAKYFEENDVPISSVSDLVRKALRTFVNSVVHQMNHIPTKSESQDIIQSIAQQGSGFSTNTPYIPIKRKPDNPYSSDRRNVLIQTLINQNGASPEDAARMADAMLKAKV